MNTPQWPSQIVPARLAFLAIYNPSLGPTDETFPDQVVFYYSRVALEKRAASKKNARNDDAGGDALREAENEKLRQVGLAQGMVDFARSFSDGHAVDSVDTEKSRIVIHELESGWWIVASIDLTQLPGIAHSRSGAASKIADKAESRAEIEYSSREVSPSNLLQQQLIQAHHVFTLHHGPSLTELFVRLAREKFCNTLERFWSRFSRTWDVLLHGNPATDVFNGITLSGGGELGIGVGEEEWGSGEREVLEDLTNRTEGLVDLVVSRFGDPYSPKDEQSTTESEVLPWLGSGAHPLASDGVIFGGINAITKPSIRNVSLWMRQIYTYGGYAYGVRDNPLRERRKRRRQNPRQPESDVKPDISEQKVAGPTIRSKHPQSAKGDLKIKDQQKGHQNKERSSQHESVPGSDNSSYQASVHPGIPPPIVATAEEALDEATRKADAASKQDTSQSRSANAGTTMGIPDQYMKYLTFGLSTYAKTSAQSRPDASRQASTTSSTAVNSRKKTSTVIQATEAEDIEDSDDVPPKLNRLDPVPDGEDIQLKIAIQKREELNGQFVIGLKGDLEQMPEDSDGNITNAGINDDPGGSRTLLRTLHVEIIPQDLPREEEEARRIKENDPEIMPSEVSQNFRRLRVVVYVHRPFMYCFLFEGRTSKLGISGFYKHLHRSLKPIHKQLLSSTSQTKLIQRIEESQASAAASDTASVVSGSKSSSKTTEPAPVYDLIYDPALMTVHTSLPNIPEPGTSAAEGIITDKKDTGLSSWPAWTRIEALNVHCQILNILSSTRHNQHEYERTSKTSRGWWVVWMKLPPSTTPTQEVPPGPLTEEPEPLNPSPSQSSASDNGFAVPSFVREESGDKEQTPTSTKIPFTPATSKKPKPPDMHRIAFLVRKASESTTNASKSTSSSRAVSSMWNTLTLRPNPTSDESTGGTSAGWGPAALAGGIGIDARKYVEGLLSLNR